mmetsp:Transcript_16119/g.44665  ORF Transcript_16119/g.44665 Transcript_16119/m.44665 type:complete len:175 (+) Transcript_16119:1219-1743(+)
MYYVLSYFTIQTICLLVRMVWYGMNRYVCTSTRASTRASTSASANTCTCVCDALFWRTRLVLINVPKNRDAADSGMQTARSAHFILLDDVQPRLQLPKLSKLLIDWLHAKIEHLQTFQSATHTCFIHEALALERRFVVRRRGVRVGDFYLYRNFEFDRHVLRDRHGGWRLLVEV